MTWQSVGAQVPRNVATTAVIDDQSTAPPPHGPGRRQPAHTCSVRKSAVLGALIGGGLTYAFWPALGRNTGQHLAWGVLITGVLSGSSAFVAAVECPRRDGDP